MYGHGNKMKGPMMTCVIHKSWFFNYSFAGFEKKNKQGFKGTYPGHNLVFDCSSMIFGELNLIVNTIQEAVARWPSIITSRESQCKQLIEICPEETKIIWTLCFHRKLSIGSAITFRPIQQCAIHSAASFSLARSWSSKDQCGQSYMNIYMYDCMDNG